MKENIEKSIAQLQNEIQTVRYSLTERKMTLQEADSKICRLENKLADLQEKLTDKGTKLELKQRELDELTRNVGNVRQVITPFKNHHLDFTAPQITDVPPTFGREKWLEKQNRRIESLFNKALAEIEKLYRTEAEKQVATAQSNQLVDYKEYRRYIDENDKLRQYIQEIAGEKDNLSEALYGLLDILASPNFRERIFTIADALIGGRPIPVSSGGGGDTSDLRWDGRNPEEDEQSYKRRCMMAAVGIVVSRNQPRKIRR